MTDSSLKSDDKTDQVTFSVLHSASTNETSTSADKFAHRALLLMLIAFIAGLILTIADQRLGKHLLSSALIFVLCFGLAIFFSDPAGLFKRYRNFVVNFSIVIFVGLLILLSVWQCQSVEVMVALTIFWLHQMSHWRTVITSVVSLIISAIAWAPNIINQPLAHSLGWLTLLITVQYLSILIYQYREKTMAELSGQIDQLEKNAGTDELTGLLNGRLMMELGQRELHRAHRMQQALSLMICDFEAFKRIKQAFGQLASDLLIRSVSGALLSSLRSTDLVGRIGNKRLGNNKFLIILPQTNLVAARELAARLVKVVDQDEFKILYQNLGLGMSIGAATIEPDTKVTISELVLLAEDALIYAKSNPHKKIAVQLVENC